MSRGRFLRGKQAGQAAGDLIEIDTSVVRVRDYSVTMADDPLDLPQPMGGLVIGWSRPPDQRGARRCDDRQKPLLKLLRSSRLKGATRPTDCRISAAIWGATKSKCLTSHKLAALPLPPLCFFRRNFCRFIGEGCRHVAPGSGVSIGHSKSRTEVIRWKASFLSTSQQRLPLKCWQGRRTRTRKHAARIGFAHCGDVLDTAGRYVN
jgi:hypothetical protein